jgi:hypothetical protein
LKEDRAKLNSRKFFAVVYRSEQKKILINQIKLVNIVLHILERVMKGVTLDFAVTRVFELESKKEFVVNRVMIANYVSSLKNGLRKNYEDYLLLKGQPEEKLLKEQLKQRINFPKIAYKQFEIKGYDKMIERILDAPLRNAEENNPELHSKILMIKE